MDDERGSMAEGAGKLGRRRASVAGVAVAALVLTLAACGDPSDDQTGSDPTPTGSAGTTAPDSAAPTLSEEELDQEVLDAYEAAQAALTAAFEAADPNHPDLLATHTGEELEFVQGRLREMQADGVSWVGTTELSFTLRSRDEHEAVVRVCVLDTAALVDTETGEVVEEPDESQLPQHLDITMRKEGGVWKSADTDDAGEHGESCDVDQYAD